MLRGEGPWRHPQRHARFEDFLSIPVVHGEHGRVFINLEMKNIAAVPLGNDAMNAHHFWIQG
jgi:hypothetical protein